MNLRDYLHFERITLKKLSSDIDMSITHISGYINGRLRVSRKVAKAIEKYTDGKVTAKEIMKDNPPKKTIQK